jgi:uncharacterized protein (TIGR02271 family)
VTPGDGGRDQQERVPAIDRPGHDSGQVEYQADGSVSIPVFEEELVCEKRVVVRERVVVRKEAVTENQELEADLRRERVDVDPDAAIVDRVSEGGDG